jgi:hypothetical protein
MKNIRHQIKSKWYYIFWGTMAIAVVSGQIYVGTGYREMAEATKSIEIFVSCIPSYDPSLYKVNKMKEFE